MCLLATRLKRHARAGLSAPESLSKRSKSRATEAVAEARRSRLSRRRTDARRRREASPRRTAANNRRPHWSARTQLVRISREAPYHRLALKRESTMVGAVRAGLRCPLQHAELLFRKTELRGRCAGMRLCARRRRRDRAHHGAEPDGDDESGRSGGNLQLPRNRDATARQDDGDRQLLERRFAQQARCLCCTGGVRPAALAHGEVSVEAHGVQLL